MATAAYAPVSEATWEHLDEFDPGVREVTRCAVRPEYQREGHGSRIYDRLEARARDDGIPTFVLTTGVENVPARAFFEALGFDSRGEVTVEADGTPLHLALYRKQLAT